MKLVVFHYHYRPGGVRRVIELALPHLIRGLKPRIETVVLAGGELPDLHWMEYLTKQLPRMSVELPTHPALGYLAESMLTPEEALTQARKAVREILQGADENNCIVWTHNLGLARNPLMARAIVDETAALGVTLIAHHHDWWFDNRWQRWPEMRRAGISSLKTAAHAVFSTLPNIRHVTINQTDFAPIQRHLGDRAYWLPNLMDKPSEPAPSAVENARLWLEEQVGEKAPFWLLPCRLLRRKNVAEALLLTRWLRPEAWLVTTALASSEGEDDYAKALSNAAQRHGWRLRLGIVQGAASAPTIPQLLAASEAVMLTSIQEGFGLPFLEAAAANRPLIARKLPNVSPDLAQFGLRFPQNYDEILVHPSLFDLARERQRQRERFRAWLAGMPASCRDLARIPVLLAAGRRLGPVPFSRLTLTAQLEVLSHSPDHSWALCAPLNPFLSPWRKAADKGQLQKTPWPGQAEQWLGGESYARRFQQIALPRNVPKLNPVVGDAVQHAFLRERFASSNLFPLLWSSTP